MTADGMESHLKADLGCGVAACGMTDATAVTDAGMAMLSCPTCGVLRIPPANLLADHVDPDPLKPLSPVLMLLFSMRMAWLGAEARQIKNKTVRFLDIGCGDGQFMSYLKQSGYTSLTGIEPDSARASNSRGRGLSIYSSLDEARAANALPESADLISVWQVLEHVDHPISFLKTYTPLLAADGVMLVSVPNQKSAQTRLFGRYAAYPDYGRHIWYHDASYLRFLNDALPGFIVSVLPDRNYEYEIFAWVESAVSAALRAPCFVNRTLKKGEGGSLRKAATAAAAIALLPVATVLAPLSITFGAPSTLTFAIRRLSATG